MSRVNLVITIIVLISCAILIVAQSNGVSRCFQFTWLGPQFNNDSVFLNATCQDATRLASGIPCQLPLVASYDGTWPDVEYIWTHHLLEASCILAANDICAQYTYYFNGIGVTSPDACQTLIVQSASNTENSTYMCTRAVDETGHSITNGCFQSNDGSASTRVCFCRSLPGGVPCNQSNVSLASAVTVFIALALVLDRRVINLS